MTRSPVYDSRAWWKKKALNRQNALTKITARLAEAEADYDTVEAELRQRINSCTCQREEK